MKIFGIQNFNNIYLGNNQKINQKGSLLNAPNNDIFVKTNQINFTGAQDKDQKKMASFSKDVLMMYHMGTFTVPQVEKVVHKYLPNLQVRSMSNLPEEYRYSKNLRGLYFSEVAIDQQTKRAISPKEKEAIYVTPVSNNSPEEVLFSCANLVHEFTHANQTHNPQKSELTVINKYLSKNSNNLDKAIEIVGNTMQFRNTVEEKTRAPMINYLCKDTCMVNRYSVLRNVDKKATFKKVYENANIDNFEEHFRKTFSEEFYKLKDSGLEVDSDFAINSMIAYCENEIEAYTNEDEFIKTVLKGYIYKDLITDMRIMTYQESIKILRRMLGKPLPR